jgi:hypothetical protein
MFHRTFQDKTVIVKNSAAYRASQSVMPMGSSGLCTAARTLRQVILVCHTNLVMLPLYLTHVDPEFWDFEDFEIEESHHLDSKRRS